MSPGPQSNMSDLLIPSEASVAALVAQFETELAAAKSAREAQPIRDRYLGRKNSVVASWMQMIGSAPPDQKKNIGRYANELKQAIETRWKTYEDTARDEAPAGSDGVTRPGRGPLLWTRHSLTPVRAHRGASFTRMRVPIVV